LKSRSFLFLFLSISLFGSCAQTHSGAGFYRGLLLRAEHQDAGVVDHFEEALSSSNIYVRQAAAEELARLMAEGTELSAKTAGRVRREVSGCWAAAFDAAENASDRKKVFSFLFGFEQEPVSLDEARLFVLRECEKQGVFFTESEYAAIEAHFAISSNKYIEALNFFRVFQEDDEWPLSLPEIFLEHPNLINDLGRAFQFTATGDEGLELFLRWDRGLEGDSDDLRYRLLFYAARVARRRGNDERALSLFEQARLLAPDEEQSDACIWYILDISANKALDVFIGRLEQYLPCFSTDSFFDDILERFLQRLVSAREWERIINVFSLIKDSRAAESTAGYAWIIARVIEEGYVDEDGILLAMREANVTEGLSAAFTQIAYDAGIRPLYYRRLSASALEQPFLVFPGETRSGGGKPSPALEFILGFFKNDAASLSQRYIDAVEKELSPDELRAVAQALAQAGMYAQSVWLVAKYINREDYAPLGIDMELWFPRPYRELVEKYAEETGIAPSLLFGLIRTESAFQSGVISRAGAVGLTQLMPETAQEMAERIRRAGGPDYAAGEDGLDLSDPGQNIHIGAYYLNYLNVRFEDILLSLLAYNGGMNRVRRLRSASTMPVDLFLETISISETRNYGRRVMAAAAVYEELYYRQER
jgi:soluble lytic murein transglycosylase